MMFLVYGTKIRKPIQITNVLVCYNFGRSLEETRHLGEFPTLLCRPHWGCKPPLAQVDTHPDVALMQTPSRGV